MDVGNTRRWWGTFHFVLANPHKRSLVEHTMLRTHHVITDMAVIFA